MIARKFQKGCAKVTDTLCNGCWKVAYRLYFDCGEVISQRHFATLSQRNWESIQ